MAHPPPRQHVPAGALARRRRRGGCSTAWSPSLACTTGCTSPTCGPAAGWPISWTVRPPPGWCPRSGPTWTAAGRPDAQRVRHRRLGGGQAQGRRRPGLRTVVLCTDVAVHRMWVAEGTDLFLVTSPAAAASVRRYLPRAPVAIVPPPVRSAFYAAPPQEQARAALGVPSADFCVLIIDSGWGFGPLVESVSALAEAGVHVLAVAGRDQQDRAAAPGAGRQDARITPFGYTDRIPELMAAADLVIALPGATTCGEARVVGRHAAAPRRHARPWAGQPAARTGAGAGTRVRSDSSWGYRQRAGPARRRRSERSAPAPPAPRWEPALVAALQRIGLDLQPAAPSRRRRAGLGCAPITSEDAMRGAGSR